MTDAQPVIQCRNVSFSYGGPPVLEEVTLAMPPCDLVCVIGPNGGGKTTLLKLLLGLIVPQTGQVRILGMPPEHARPRIGYMPQHIHLDIHFPVYAMDVVLMGRLGNTSRFGPYRRSDKVVAQRCLAEVGAAHVANRTFADLSGGQRQRVLIARALACEPELLLLDEPTAGLDPAAQEDLHATLRELNRRFTVIMVSHDIGFVSLYFKTVICVHGHVHTHASSELTSRQVADMYGREVRLVHANADRSQADPTGGEPAT